MSSQSFVEHPDDAITTSQKQYKIDTWLLQNPNTK